MKQMPSRQSSCAKVQFDDLSYFEHKIKENDALEENECLEQPSKTVSLDSLKNEEMGSRSPASKFI